MPFTTLRLSRRDFVKKGGVGALSAGLLAPLWKAIAATGDITKAYPDHLLSISEYTKGRINPGDYITADNVDIVKELMEPAKYKHVKDMGRKLKVVETTTDYMRLGPWEYLEATLRNQGKARFDKKKNVVTENGEPWIGGNPFPNATTALELFAGLTLSWGRHDASVYAVREYDIGHHGGVEYQYDLAWAELSPVARNVLEPKPYWPEHKDKLRFNTVVFVAPGSQAGTSYLNIWPYDQHKMPYLYGYVPDFKRIRQFPTNQRFEPLVPGSALYLSDAWAAGDPLHTWGNYRIIGRQPLLAGVSDSWAVSHPNWEHATHGGPEGESFFDTSVELVPEAIIAEAEPVAFERAPVSKKRVWFDARNQMPIAMVTYDRKGLPFRSFDGGYGLYESGDRSFMDGDHPYWSWCYLHAYEFQTGRISRFEQVRELTGGHRTSVNNDSIYEQYLTQNAIRSLGGV